MKKLLSYVLLAIGVISGYRKTIAAQKEEIERLQALADKEDLEDEEREAKLAELESLEAESAAKADELARLLNDEPVVPSVHPETFEVTSEATAPLSDLAFRDRRDETAGAPVAGVGTAATPRPAGAPAGEQTGEQGENQKTESVDDLTGGNSKDELLALAEKEGVEVKSGDTKEQIAQAIFDARASK